MHEAAPKPGRRIGWAAKDSLDVERQVSARIRER
jgi:hypothetical protein